MRSTINKLRLAYLEALIIRDDSANRKDLQVMFKIGSAAASRDFKHYHDLYPGNIYHCLVTRCYKATPEFKSQALTTMYDEFLVNLLALEDYF